MICTYAESKSNQIITKQPDKNSNKLRMKNGNEANVQTKRKMEKSLEYLLEKTHGVSCRIKS